MKDQSGRCLASVRDCGTGAPDAEVLRKLVTERGVSAVLVECGGRLAASLLEAGLVDEWVAFLAPMLCGGPVPALAGEGFPDGLRLKQPEFRRFGNDVMLRAEVLRD